MDYDIALVAYAPNGARIGNLPQPLSINVSSTLNDLGSLIFTYPAASAASETLASPVEIAVEVLGADGNWVEPPNMRFMNLSWSKNMDDQAEVVTYTCPGYAWQLNKAVAYPPDASVKVEAVENATEESKTAAAAYKAANDSLRSAIGLSSSSSIVLSGYQPTVVNNGIWVKTDAVPTPHKGYIKDSTRTWTAVTTTAAMNAAKAVVTTKTDADAAESKVTRLKNDKSIARVFAGASAGTLVGTFLSEAKARGALPAMTFSFGSSTDSSNRKWARIIPQYELNAGAPLFPVLDTLATQGLCDWRTVGRSLELYNPDTTLAANATASVNLIYGRDISDAPDKGTLTELVGSLLFVGDEGLNFEMKNESAPSPWGVWEGSVSQGGVTNEASGRLFGQTALNAGSAERVESTRQLILDTSEQLPFVHYGVGDFILAPGPKGTQDEMRVRQITLSRDNAGNVTGNVVLNDRFVERSIREAKKIAGIFGGSGNGGSGTPVKPTPGADTRTPRPATDLQAMPDVYISDDGAMVGIVQAAWFHDGMATDQTLIDIDKHVLEYAEVNAAGYIDGGWKVGSESQHPLNSVGLDGLRPKRANGTASEYRFRVRTTAYNGKTNVSQPIQVTMVADVEAPPVPQFRAEDVTTWLRTVTVRWNGKGMNGNFVVEMPRDFDHVNVYQAPIAAGPWTLVGSIGAKHELWQSDMMPTVETWFALTALDRTGNESARSTPRSIKPSANVDMTDIIQTIDAGRVTIENAGKIMLESGLTLAKNLADNKALGDEAIRGLPFASPNAPKPADGTGRPTGATWQRLNAAGKQIGFWRWDGAVWVEMSLDPVVIPVINIGSGTAGDLDISRLTATDADIGTAVIDKLWADFARFKRVEADMVLIGAGTNLVVNGFGEFGDATNFPGTSFVDNAAALGARGSFRVQGTMDFITPESFGVEAEKKYSLSLYARGDRPDAKLYVAIVTTGPGATSMNVLSNVTVGTTWGKPFEVEFTAPPLSTGAQLRFFMNHPNSPDPTGYMYVAGVAVREKIGASLIVNGGILAKHLTVTEEMWAEIINFKKIRGDQIEANTITADEINVGSLRVALLTINTIKATMIDADAITAKHTITGAKFQTHASPNTGIKINDQLGLRAYDINGATTLEVNANGDATFNGVVTAKSDDHQVRVMPSVYNSKPGVQFRTGTYHSTQPFIVGEAGGLGVYTGSLHLSSAAHSGEPPTVLRLGAGRTWWLGSSPTGATADEAYIFGQRGSVSLNTPGGTVVASSGYSSMSAGTGGTRVVSVSEASGIRLSAPDINSFGTFEHQGTMRVRGGLSVEGSKNFVMPHPNREGMELFHASTESAVSGVEYWGTGTVAKSGEAIVRLPHYFEDLTKARNRATLVTSQGAPVTWSAISDNSFVVTGEPGTTFSWLVKAERFGGDFDVEAWAVPPAEQPAAFIPSNPSEESA